MKKILFATGNENKIIEAQKIFDGPERTNFKLLSLKDFSGKNIDEPEENGKTFEENAYIKAKYYSQKFNISCFSEDSGLEISALNGDPGIFSSRYAKIHRSRSSNVELILEKMKEKTFRNAKFVACICFLSQPDASPIFFRGVINGTISEQKKGRGGFGYDPIFIPEGHTHTFAEMGEKKQRISHRKRAISLFLKYIEESI